MLVNVVTYPFRFVYELESYTVFPMTVGNTGAFSPDCIKGIACHVMIEVPIASHVTVPSITEPSSVVGQTGSVAAELPGVG
jgi:hypothetical protein